MSVQSTEASSKQTQKQSSAVWRLSSFLNGNGFWSKAAFAGNFKEASEKTMQLPDVRESTFELFANWLYCQRYEMLPREDEDDKDNQEADAEGGVKEQGSQRDLTNDRSKRVHRYAKYHVPSRHARQFGYGAQSDRVLHKWRSLETGCDVFE
ncbi:hypothetical protein BDR22DRAFT_821528 [Usnea florida]